MKKTLFVSLTITAGFIEVEKLKNIKLSVKSYGGNAFLYVLCLLGGFLPLRSAQGIELHHQLFATLPGFTWISFGSFILGVIYMFVFAWIFAAYFVWMHNSSLINK